MNNTEDILMNIYNDIKNYVNDEKLNPGVDNLYKSIGHHFSKKGKMLRPSIMLKVNEDLNGDFYLISKFATALELIHNYSLIHDDLPAMDDDDYRRGQLTIHKKFDEASAILAGDYLLTKAFEIVSDVDNDKVSCNYVKAINELAANSNDFGMIGGQFLDLNFDYLNTKDSIMKMYEYKTSALFKSAFKIPGILLGLDDNKIRTLDDLGRDFGLFFQIKDDLDDIEEDMAIGKITLIRELGIDKVKEILKNLEKNIITNLEKLNLTNTKTMLSDLYEK